MLYIKQICFWNLGLESEDCELKKRLQVESIPYQEAFQKTFPENDNKNRIFVERFSNTIMLILPHFIWK